MKTTTPMPAKTKPAKLPKAFISRVIDDYDCGPGIAPSNQLIGDGLTETEFLGVPVAVIPTHTKAQARRILKAAPFLALSREEQVERVAKGLWLIENPGAVPYLWEQCRPFRNAENNKHVRNARAVLDIMGMGEGR